MSILHFLRPRRRSSLVALATITASFGAITAVDAAPASAAPAKSGDCVLVKNGSFVTIYFGNGNEVILKCVDGVLIRVDAPTS